MKNPQDGKQNTLRQKNTISVPTRFTPLRRCRFDKAWLETNSIAILHKLVKKHDIVGFDIDETLLGHAESKDQEQYPGSVKWYDDMKNVINHLTITDDMRLRLKQALITLFIIYNKKHASSPLETDVSEKISQIQQQGAVTIAITARSADLYQATMRDLKTSGIDFSKDWPNQKTIVDLQNRGCYGQGLMCCGQASKGSRAEQYFAIPAHQQHLANLKANKGTFYFVDDKTYNLKSLLTFCRKHGVRFVGVLHTKSQHKFTNCRINNSDMELLYRTAGFVYQAEKRLSQRHSF